MTSIIKTNLSIEYGTNTNGAYYKFSDGTLICTKKVTFSSVAITKAFGSWYESTAVQNFGNWAHSFTATPSVSVQCINEDSKTATVELLRTSATAIGSSYLMRPTSDTHKCVFMVIGIGRWK